MSAIMISLFVGYGLCTLVDVLTVSNQNEAEKTFHKVAPMVYSLVICYFSII